MLQKYILYYFIRTLLLRLLSIDDIKRLKVKRSKSMVKLNELTLAEELNLDLNEIIEDKYKTTDIIKVSFIYGLKV